LLSRKPGFSLKKDVDDNLADSVAARELGIDANSIDDTIDKVKTFVASMASI